MKFLFKAIIILMLGMKCSYSTYSQVIPASNTDIQALKKWGSYEEYLTQDSSLNGVFSYYFAGLLQQQYSYYFQFITNMDVIVEDMKKGNEPDIIRKILEKNKDFFKLYTMPNGNLMVYHDSIVIGTIDKPFNPCELAEERKDVVRLFDEGGIYSHNEDIEREYRKAIWYLQRKYYLESTLFQNSETPVHILYQYDTLYGFAALCPCESNLMENQLIREMENLASEYCKKYKLGKIIFSGFAPL